MSTNYRIELEIYMHTYFALRNAMMGLEFQYFDLLNEKLMIFVCPKFKKSSAPRQRIAIPNIIIGPKKARLPTNLIV